MANERVCKFCGKTFIARWAKYSPSIFCSRSCSSRNNWKMGISMGRARAGTMVECLVCKSPFYRKPCNSRLKCCSRECADISRSFKPIQRICKICGKTFQVTKRHKNCSYCSYDCRRKTVKPCLECNSEYLGLIISRFCSIRCARTYELKRREADGRNLGVYYRRAIKRLGKFTSCSKCGFSAHPSILQVHHKDGNRSNNSIENLEILCPNCHALQHKHLGGQ